MTDARRRLGAHGERLACAHLTERGYALLERNFRTRHGELDVVVRDGRFLVFCEIKTRASDRYGPPQAAVGRVKQRRLRILAVEWLAAHERHGAIRFDVAAITGVRIEVFEAAF